MKRKHHSQSNERNKMHQFIQRLFTAISCWLVLFLFFLTSQAHANEVNTTAKSAVDNYTVEVIIFENHAIRGWTEELWPNEIELPFTDEATTIDLPGTAPLWVVSRNRQLMNEAKKMANDYKILFHRAWSQNATENTKTVLLEGDPAADTHLTGTLQLIKTRFAHVHFDIEVEKRIPKTIREDFAQHQQVDLNLLPTHWRFNLKENRKIKPGELHYIDHPLFGILVQIKQN